MEPEPVSAPALPVTCPCGETWTSAEWLELPPAGRYDAGKEGWMELRACVCGRTLSVPCKPPRAP